MSLWKSENFWIKRYIRMCRDIFIFNESINGKDPLDILINIEARGLLYYKGETNERAG